LGESAKDTFAFIAVGDIAFFGLPRIDDKKLHDMSELLQVESVGLLYLSLVYHDS
jgi:hypothetical protein